MTRPNPTKKRLSDMKITEVSLVDEPANQHARAEITKRADPSTKETTMRKYAETDLDLDDEIDLVDGDEADLDADDDADDDAEGGEEFTEQDLEDAIDIIEAALAEDPQDEGVVKLAKFAAFAVDAFAAMDKMEEAVAEGAEEIVKRDAIISEMEGQIRKMGAEPVSKRAEQIDISTLSEPIRKQLQEGSIALEEVAKMRAKEEQRVLIAKAAADGIDANAAAVMFRVYKNLATSADVGALWEILKRAEAAIQASPMLKSLGESGGGDATVEGRIAHEAEAIFKSARAAGEPITMEQAVAKAYRENPALYEEYQRSRKAR